MFQKLLIPLMALFVITNAQNGGSIQTNVSDPQISPNPVVAQTGSTTNVTTIAPTTANTTTEAPIPTTTKASTTTPTAPSTTKASVTTLAPTVPPTPTPVPDPKQWNGTVSEHNKTCINVEFAVKISIHYNNTNHTESTTGFTIPTDAVVDLTRSHCSSNETKEEMITISFLDSENTSANLSLTFNRSEGNVFVERVDLSFILTKELFPQIVDPKVYGTIVSTTQGGLSLFKVASDHSYTCSNAQSASLEPPKNEGLVNVEIDFSSSQVEAYSTSNARKFDTAIDCKSTEISDVVPIAVGAALAGLVVIVLIAYFIGRRRSRRLAYQSV